MHVMTKTGSPRLLFLDGCPDFDHVQYTLTQMGPDFYQGIYISGLTS